MNTPNTFSEAYMEINTEYFQIPAYFYAYRDREKNAFVLTTEEPEERCYKYSSYLEMMADLLARGYAGNGITIIPDKNVLKSAEAERKGGYV